jgi:Leucine-rich repeat (LRR) protein
MKKTFLMVAIFLLNVATCFTVKASVVLNGTNFPDANFRAVITATYGVADGSTISDGVIVAVDTIQCSSRNITDLKGIEYFPNLIDLECDNNQLTALNLSGNTLIKSVNCDKNQLTSLDLSNNHQLLDLKCNHNQLTSINANSTNTPLLNNLECDYNQVSSLDLSGNSGLINVSCQHNTMTSLNVSGSPLLQYLNCGNNGMTSLTLPDNSSLTNLSCDSNQLATLNLRNNTRIYVLHCSCNQLTALDVSHLFYATSPTKVFGIHLFCDHNQLTTLNFSNNSTLSELACNDNQLISITMPTAAPNANYTGPMVNGINCMNNPNLHSLDVSACPYLFTLWCDNCGLSKLDVSNSPNLNQLSCSNNQLTSLDVSHNATLQSLQYQNNHLAALDLSNNSAIYQLYGYDNSRTIKAYSYQRSAANGGGIGYYVPFTAQPATDITINGVTTHYPATKDIATLIDDAGQESDTPFDSTKVVADSWDADSWSPAYASTVGTLNGVKVLYLDNDSAVTYQYKTGFTGTCTNWYVYYGYSSYIKKPIAFFTLHWTSNGIITGVDGVECNDVDVYTANGAINIGGSFNGNVNVYNLRGQQVYCGRDSEIAVPAGMYVVKVGGKVHKVAVR